MNGIKRLMASKKRRLVCFIVFCAGVLLAVIPFIPTIIIGVIACALSLATFLAYRSSKTVYLNSGTVNLLSGTEYDYVILCVETKLKTIILPFLTPFYFTPIEKNYYIVHNARCYSNFAPKTQIEDFDKFNNICHAEKITEEEYNRIASDLQYSQQRFNAYNIKQKNNFIANINKYETINYLKKVYDSETCSICKMEDGDLFLFLYYGTAQNQIGIKVTEKFADSIKNQTTSFGFENLLRYAKTKSYIYYCELNDALYKEVYYSCTNQVINQNENINEIMLYPQQQGVSVPEQSVQSNNNVSTATTVSVINNEVQNTVENVGFTDNRNIITNENIGRLLKSGKRSGFMLLAIILYTFAGSMSTGATMALFMGPISIIGALVGGALVAGMLFLAIKAHKKAKSYPKVVSPDNFTVNKVVCIKVRYKDTSGTGNKKYEYFFNDGTVYEGDLPNVKEGNPCGVIIRNDTNEPVFVYSLLYNKFADDVKVIDRIG